jgi:hypothetical protein
VFDWIFDLPLWIVGPVLIALLVALALGGLAVVRARVLPRLRITVEDSEFAGTLVQGVMVFYGLAVALIAVNVMDTYGTAANVVSSEAAAIAGLYRCAGSYPEPVKSQLQNGARRYVEYVIREEWPQQRRGRVPGSAVSAAGGFYSALTGFEPATEGQKIVHAETWRLFNRIVELRRERLDNVKSGLPAVMWMIVVIGALISLSASYFFRVEDGRFQAILITLLATFMALVIFVVLAMDRPFRGDLGISPEAFQLVLDQVMAR